MSTGRSASSPPRRSASADGSAARPSTYSRETGPPFAASRSSEALDDPAQTTAQAVDVLLHAVPRCAEMGSQPIVLPGIVPAGQSTSLSRARISGILGRQSSWTGVEQAEYPLRWRQRVGALGVSPLDRTAGKTSCEPALERYWP